MVIDRGYHGSAKTLQNAEETLPKNIESIELKDLSGATNDVIGTTRDVETALKTIDDPSMDVVWATQAASELAGVREAMTRMRDELANNLAKLSDADVSPDRKPAGAHRRPRGRSLCRTRAEQRHLRALSPLWHVISTVNRCAYH